MGRYFGTDGFRGEANVDLTADHAYQVGRFLGWYYGELKRRAGDETPVVVRDGTQQAETGRKKVGAMLGDHVEIGCNSVLNPGTVVGRNSRVYPLSSVRGTVPADSIYKRGGDIAAQRED